MAKLIEESVRLFIANRRGMALRAVEDAILPNWMRSAEEHARLKRLRDGMGLAWDRPDFDPWAALTAYALEVADVKAGRQAVTV